MRSGYDETDLQKKFIHQYSKRRRLALFCALRKSSARKYVHSKLTLECPHGLLSLERAGTSS